MSRNQDLIVELNKVLSQINFQLQKMQEEHERSMSATSLGLSAYEMKNPDGKYMMADLLCAKANALAAMASLRTAK